MGVVYRHYCMIGVATRTDLQSTKMSPGRQQYSNKEKCFNIKCDFSLENDYSNISPNTRLVLNSDLYFSLSGFQSRLGSLVYTVIKH